MSENRKSSIRLSNYSCEQNRIYLAMIFIKLPSEKYNSSLLHLISIILFAFTSLNASPQHSSCIKILQTPEQVKPLDDISIYCNPSGLLTIKDSRGRSYIRLWASDVVKVKVQGATGVHTVTLSDKKGRIVDQTVFSVIAETSIDDGGKISDIFHLFRDGMFVYDADGTSEITWNGRTYRYFVEWVLDNSNTMKGMQYFSPYSRDLVDLLKENQQPNGMIWSFVNNGDDASHYYNTAYAPINYFKKDKDAWFVRQPVENHVEYNYVNMIYQHWKASGDSDWMKGNLLSAALALDYCITDSVRWSKRFNLLKRPYCIDSWDFQVDDEYTPYSPISPTMVIVPGKTKFGIFFGDNTGYFEACNQLAEMFAYAGQSRQASIYQNRANAIMEKLTALSWNGSFFKHFIDEDPAVVRNLGVDEESQIAQGNMYSINRGLPHEKNVAIIKTYLNLKQHLPEGSPGEWYAIYPPFEKGFGGHNTKWQYMNGGVAGHAAGELARGAFENGYEKYGNEILNKLFTLGKENGNRVWFAYTGSIPAPPVPPVYKSLNIAAFVNMDLWDQGSKNTIPWMNTSRPGNDMRGLPTGNQVFQNIPFAVIDPISNQHKAAIGVSTLTGFPENTEVLVNDTASTIYLLHSSSDNVPSNVAGTITFNYNNGIKVSKHILKDKEVTNWWFPTMENEHAGVAWWGPNLCSTKVGVCWAAINNPHPEYKIASLTFHAPREGGIYAVLGITLSNRLHYVKPSVESYGGPDNWSAATALAALVEGLAGVKNLGLAFDTVRFAPRWTAAGIDSVKVTVHFAASKGYLAYHYQHDMQNKKILYTITGSGNKIESHVLLPEGYGQVKSITVNNQLVSFSISKIENSTYADFTLSLPKVSSVCITYF